MRFILSAVLIITLSVVGKAQRSYRFETISVDDGLSQSGVLCMQQDKLGYLWIGTQDGLNRYDGHSFEVFRHKEGDSTSLPKNFITNLFLDHKNNLWVGTFGHLSKFNHNTQAFTNHRVKKDVFPNKATSRVFLCRDNTFALTDGEELLFFDPDTGSLFGKEEFKSLKRVTAYFETKTNGDWIFAETVKYKPHAQREWQEISVSGLPHYDERTDQLFLRKPTTILKFDAQTNQWLEVFGSTGEILVNADGSYWIGNANRIEVYNPLREYQQQIPAQTLVPGSRETFLNSLYQTRDGVIWVGTNGYGLKKYNAQTNRFDLINTSPNANVRLSHPYVDAIYTPDDTTLYVSTPVGLDIINVQKNTVQHVRAPSRIQRMTMDGRGKLWCITFQGLYILQNQQFNKITDWNEFQKQKTDKGLIDVDWITHIFEKGGASSNDLLFRGCLTGDSIWINGSGIGNDFTWIDLTVANFKTGQILQSFTYEPANPTSAPRSESIKLIFQDSRKNIWIGSNSEGLCLFNPIQKNFTHFTEKDGLPNNVVYGILEDDNQNLWLSTNKGLCEFNPLTKKIRNFDLYDGLQSNEFNTGAYFKSASGKMYFGGVNGVTYFHPKDVITATALPQSTISGYYVNNVLLRDYSDYVQEDVKTKALTLTLQYHERDFGFDVVGIGFSLPGRTNYRYILETYDKEWHDIGNLRHISFTNIPPGTYIFKVQSSDSYGNWESTGASITVLIQSPFWRNVWVWIISGLFMFTALVMGYWFRVRQLKNQTQRLENTVAERTQEILLQKDKIENQNKALLAQARYLEEKNIELEKAKGLLEIEVKYLHQHQLLKSSIQTQEDERKRIAQDLHDELGAVLSIARMHLVQVQKTSDPSMQASLQQARISTEAALATMRRISHDLMPPQLEMFGLAKTLESITKQMQGSNNITVDFYANENVTRWSIPVELGLYRICMELINNTIKHAGATQINMVLKELHDHILFIYTDNGKGLPDVVNMGHGFKNIEARVNIMGGSLTLGNGTRGGFSATVKIFKTV